MGERFPVLLVRAQLLKGEGVMGFRPTQVGLVFLVVPVVMVVASLVNGLLYDKLIPSQQSVDLQAAPAKTLGPVDAGHAYSSATSIAIRAQSQRLCGL